MVYIPIFLALCLTVVYGLLVYAEQDIKFNVPFLKNHVARIIDGQFLEHNVTISFIKVATAKNFSKIIVEINGINVTNLKAENSVYINKASIEFDLIDLISSKNTDYSVILSDVPITVERTLKNDFAITAGNFKVFPFISDSNFSKNKFGNIKFLRIDNPDLTIRDQSSQISIQPSIDRIKLNLLENLSTLSFQAFIPQTDEKEAIIEFSAKYSHQSESTEVFTKIKSLIPSHFPTIINSRFDVLKRINIPVSASIDFEIDKSGTIRNYVGTFNTKNFIFEKGRFFNQNYKLDDLTFDFSSSVNDPKVLIKNILINSNFLVSSGSGELNFKDSFEATFFFPKFNLIGITKSTENFEMSNASFDFDFDGVEDQVFLKRANLSYGTTDIILEGRLSVDKKMNQKDHFKLNVLNIDFENLQNLSLLKNKNLVTNILAFNKVNDLNLVLDWHLDSSMEAAYDGHVTFNEAWFRFLTSRPEEFRLLDGFITFNHNTITLNSKELLIRGFKSSGFVLNDMELALVDIKSRPKSSFKTKFKIDLNKFDKKEIELSGKKFGLKFVPNVLPADFIFSGIVKGSFEAEFTDLNFTKLTSDKVTAEIKLDDYYIDLISLTKPVKISTIDIRASKQEILLEVNGSFNQKPLFGLFTKVFIEDVASTLKVLWQPDLIDLDTIFAKEFEYSGHGELVVQADITFPPKRPPIYRFKANITDVELSIPSLGLIKKKEDLGNLEFGWTKFEPTSFMFVTENYELSGLVHFNSKKGVDRIFFHKVKLGDYFLGDALYLTGELENNIEVNGQMFDYKKSPKNQLLKAKKKLKINVNFAKIKIRKNLELNEFIGSFYLNEVFKGSGVGWLNSGPKVQIDVDIKNTKKSFKAYSNSAGEVLLTSNVYSSGYGGDIRLEMHQKPGEDLKGSVYIKNLKVIGAPFLANLIALSSVEGIYGLLTSNGIVFNEIKAKYSLSKGVLQIKNGVAVNPSFGITLSGSRKMDDKTIDYSGVLSPAYSLNGSVKKIPLIGNILGGSEGEGVFGINYFATGALQNPYISVDPLSLITPGQFRKLLN